MLTFTSIAIKDYVISIFCIASRLIAGVSKLKWCDHWYLHCNHVIFRTATRFNDAWQPLSSLWKVGWIMVRACLLMYFYWPLERVKFPAVLLLRCLRRCFLNKTLICICQIYVQHHERYCLSNIYYTKTKFFLLRATIRKNLLVINLPICKLLVIIIKFQFFDFRRTMICQWKHFESRTNGQRVHKWRSNCRAFFGLYNMNKRRFLEILLFTGLFSRVVLSQTNGK